MFCNNQKCNYTTFAEIFEFLPHKAKKSKRLTNQIMNLSLNISFITASGLLRDGIADVGKSAICNLLKKGIPTINETTLLEIGGISRDIEAVKNEIKYEYNNGLAEGSVNKLKLIKRIMYGRNSFNLLKNKLLRLE